MLRHQEMTVEGQEKFFLKKKKIFLLCLKFSLLSLYSLVFFLQVCLCECVRPSGTEVTDSYELPRWMLGIVPRSSLRAASGLNCRVLSPTPENISCFSLKTESKSHPAASPGRWTWACCPHPSDPWLLGLQAGITASSLVFKWWQRQNSNCDRDRWC